MSMRQLWKITYMGSDGGLFQWKEKGVKDTDRKSMPIRPGEWSRL